LKLGAKYQVGELESYMWRCSQCGEEVEDNFEVCWNCQLGKDGTGQSIRQLNQHPQVAAPVENAARPRFCPNCGTKVDVDSKFCKNCAAPVNKAVTPNSSYRAMRFNKTVLVIGGIIIAAFLIILLTNSSRPTKEHAIQTLKDILTAHNKGNYERALSYLRNDEAERDYRQAIRTGSTPHDIGVSTKSIDALAEKGELTTLTDYIDSWRPKISNIPADFPQIYGRKYNVPVETCYVLSMGGSGIAFYWDGKDLKLIAAVDPHDKAGDFEQ
jgi:hypothetical protein